MYMNMVTFLISYFPRKAVRAALLLLPLLGITNIMDIVPGPVDGTPLQFAIWSYSTHVLSALQGSFISLLYCFLNREVCCLCHKIISCYKSFINWCVFLIIPNLAAFPHRCVQGVVEVYVTVKFFTRNKGLNCFSKKYRVPHSKLHMQHAFSFLTIKIT